MDAGVLPRGFVDSLVRALCATMTCPGSQTSALQHSPAPQLLLHANLLLHAHAFVAPATCFHPRGQAVNVYHDGSEGLQNHFDDAARFVQVHAAEQGCIACSSRVGMRSWHVIP